MQSKNMIEKWEIYYWDEVSGEDSFFVEKTKEDLIAYINTSNNLHVAYNCKTGEKISNNKLAHPDWIYMRERWGALPPECPFLQKRKCFIDSNGDIRFIDELKDDEYKINQKSNYTEIEIIEFGGVEEFVAASYVLYDSQDQLEKALL